MLDERVWAIDVASREFTPIDTSPDDVVWHESVFAGHGDGITDRGGPPAVAELRRLREVDVIHRFILMDPNRFFATSDAIWGYTGKVGEAPDFVGFSSPANIHVGEIKWQDGWHRRLTAQLQRYISAANWAGAYAGKHLSVHIAAPQTAARALIRELVGLSPQLWPTLSVRLGFLQLGWLPQNDVKAYLRVVWVEGDAWDGDAFQGVSCRLGIHG